MIKGRRCPEIDCTETYAHCYMNALFSLNGLPHSLSSVLRRVPICVICALLPFGAMAFCLALRKASCTSHLRRNVRVAAKAHHVHCTQLPFPKYTYRVLARAHVFFLVPAGVAHDVPHADKTIQDQIVAVVLAHPDAIV